MNPRSQKKRQELLSYLKVVTSKKDHSNEKKLSKEENLSIIEEQINQLERIEKEITNNFSKINRKEAISEFYKWASENNAEYKGVKITEFDGYDLGLEATKDFKKDEIFINIPKNMILTLENCDKDLKELFDKFKNSYISLYKDNIKFALVLIVEKLKGNKSFWKPYLDLLPTKYTVPLYYSNSQMKHIQPTQLFQSAMKMLTNVMEQYAAIHYDWSTDLLFEKNYSNPALDLIRNHLTFDLFRWATATLMTRQNIIPHFANDSDIDQMPVKMIPALIPFWDMANHDPKGYISTQYHDQKHSIESATMYDIKKGEQIFIYYGDRNNTEMLLNNGFFSPEHDIGMWVNTTDNISTKRLDLLEKFGITNPKLFILPLSSKPNYFTTKLLTVYRILAMDESLLETWLNKNNEDFNEITKIEQFDDKQLEIEFWKLICLKLSEFCRKDVSNELENLEITRKRKGRVAAMLLEYRCLESEIFRNAAAYALKTYNNSRTKV